MSNESILHKQRTFVGLELCRFICAASVIIWHYQHFFVIGIWNDSIDAAQRGVFPVYWLLWPFYQHGYLAVNIFWAVSGFIFFWKYGTSISAREVGARKFFILRFSRLYPLHIITLLFVAVLQMLYGLEHGTAFIYGNNDLKHFLLQIALASNWINSQPSTFNGPIWSISVEVLVYIAFFVLMKLCRPNITFCCAVVLAANVLLFIKHSFAIQCLSIFFEGGLVYIFTRWLKDSHKIFAWIVAVTLACGFLCCVDFEKLFPNGYASVLAILIVVFFVTLEKIFPEMLADVAWLGNLTYSSYLIHFPMQLVAVLAIDWLGFDRRIFLSPFALVSFLSITFVFAWFVFVYFEMPMQRIIRGYYDGSFGISFRSGVSL